MFIVVFVYSRSKIGEFCIQVLWYLFIFKYYCEFIFIVFYKDLNFSVYLYYVIYFYR